MHGNATCVGFLGWPAGFGRPVGRGYANNHILSENGWFEAMPLWSTHRFPNSQVLLKMNFSNLLYLAENVYGYPECIGL